MTDVTLEHRFDRDRKRHYLNDELMVLHCHHYATLFTQLAIDAGEIVDGTEILHQTAEDVFSRVLEEYYRKHGVSDPRERMEIGKRMFSAMGMGTMNIVRYEESGGEVELPHAYLDEGWKKKWGKADSPVNFIGDGYVAGMFRAVYGKPPRTYTVTETASQVKGDGKSVLKVSA